MLKIATIKDTLRQLAIDLETYADRAFAEGNLQEDKQLYDAAMHAWDAAGLIEPEENAPNLRILYHAILDADAYRIHYYEVNVGNFAFFTKPGRQFVRVLKINGDEAFCIIPGVHMNRVPLRFLTRIDSNNMAVVR